MRKVEINQRYFYQYLTVFFIILISGSLYYSTYLKNSFLIPFLGWLIYIYYHYKAKKLKLSLDYSRLMFVIFTALIVLMNPDSSPRSSIVLITCLICALLITEILSCDEFIECYIKVITFLSIVSWLYLLPLYFDCLSPLPDFISIVKTTYSNFVFFGVYRAPLPLELAQHNYMVTRNSGIFWEPGAFQIFVNLGYYFSILINKISKKLFFIFLITQITIASSTGVLVFILLTGLAYLKYKNMNNTLNKIKIFLVAILFFIVLNALSILNKIVEKFDENSSSFMSFASRRNDFILDVHMFYDNILMGIGYGNLAFREKIGLEYFGVSEYLSEFQPTGADGIALFLAYVGVLGLIVIKPLLMPVQIRNWTLGQRVIVFLCMLLMFNNQNMFSYLLPWVLILYSLNIKKVQIVC